MARDVPTLSFRESQRFKALYLLPGVLQGLFTRRPAMVSLLSRLDSDGRAHRLLEGQRRKYAAGTFLLRGGQDLVITEPEVIRRVLEESPDPWGPRRRSARAWATFSPSR